ncbi:MAG: serine/threonine protein kinase [Nannocystis sp.]|nr:serine/threonine protein kinase [Nannocystis sp.]
MTDPTDPTAHSSDDRDSPATKLRLGRPDGPSEREEIDTQLHLGEMRRHFAEAPPAPVQFRKWQIERKLGQGGMGAVYLARDPALDRPVALKLITAHGAEQPRDAAREARALAALHHDHIVQIYSVDDSAPRTVVIEMEYIDGPTLRAWSADPARTWRQIVTAILQAGEGLAALHRSKLIHRDVKPDNILISRSTGRVKLSDLGLAVAADRPISPNNTPERGPLSPLGLRLTATGALLGTHGYIAPELILGAPATPKSDLFALAATLHEALFRALPFVGDTPAQLADAIQSGRLHIPPTAPRAPTWLLALLQRALAAAPERRPSLPDFLQALRRGLHRRRDAALAAIILGAAATLPWLGWHFGPAPPDPCADAGAPIATIRRGLAESVRQDHLFSQTLDALATAWSDANTRLCLTQRRRSLTDAPSRISSYLQRDCLAHTLTTLETLLEPLARTAPASPLLADTVAAIEALPRCDLPTITRWKPARPDTAAALASALNLEILGDYPRAAETARPISEGEESPYFRAEALYRLGHVLGMQHQRAASDRALRRARTLAFAAGHDDLYCRAAAFQAKVSANVALDVRQSARDLEDAQACIERLGARSPILRGDLLEAQGLLAYAEGRHEQAVRHHRVALEHRREHLGEQHPDLATSLLNLGNATLELGQHETAIAYLEDALQRRQRLFGAAHPLVADVLLDRGSALAAADQPAAARESFRQALEIYDQLRSGDGDHTRQAKAHLALAQLALAEGDHEAAAHHLGRAREHHQRADLPPGHKDRIHRLHTEGQLAARQRDFARAAPLFDQALALARPPPSINDTALELLPDWIEAHHDIDRTHPIVDIALAHGPELRGHLTRSPDHSPERRALIAWYVADHLERAAHSAEAAPFFGLALAYYESLSDPPASEVTELREHLARARGAAQKLSP